jgi:hypothetical protein
MKELADSIPTSRQRKPLTAAIAALFALAAPETFAATTWVVKNCTDAQPNSLRAIVSSAVSGDTVDLSKLGSTYSCPGNTIALTSGALTLAQSTITLSGPPGRITITGYYNGGYQNDRLIKHTGAGGTLYLQHVNLEYSKFSPAGTDARGGCIYSAGSVNLSNVTVFHCRATASAAGKKALGGGIYALGNLNVKYSLISGNTATATGPAFAPSGGGAYVNGNLTASYSTISSNSTPYGNFGGIAVNGNATISTSTVSGNSAAFVGGLRVFGLGGTHTLAITNSTISGNHSTAYIGGISTSTANTSIRSSTIAFNTAVSANAEQGPGLYIFNGYAAGHTFSIELESSILSNNTYGGIENDFGAHAPANTFNVTSNNNIIRSAPGAVRPATVTTACPLLAPLRDNGGPTFTHALLSHSPAIDSGNNDANLNEDQRGRPFVDPNNPYPHARSSGLGPDIGAYEVQQADVVFNAGFDGCPSLF